MKCTLCRNDSDTTYEVERGNPKPICSTCFGRWAPKELDALLGVKPPYSHTPSRPVVAGTALSHLDAVRCQSASSSNHASGSQGSHPPGSPPESNEGGKHEVLDHGAVFDNHCSHGTPLVG